MVQLTPVAAHTLQDRLDVNIEKLRGTPFEDLAYEALRGILGLRKDTGGSAHKKWEDGIRRIVFFESDADVLFRSGIRNFPFIDFASSRTRWHNAKSANARRGKVVVSRREAFLGKMDEFMGSIYTPEEIKEKIKRDPPTLVIVTNGDFQVETDKKEVLAFFEVTVQIEVMNLRELGRKELTDCIGRMRRTGVLLNEFNKALEKSYRVSAEDS